MDEYNKLIEPDSPMYVEGTEEDELFEALDVPPESEMKNMLLDGSAHRDLPDNKNLGTAIFDDKISARLATNNYHGILRGWYGQKDKPRWCPQQSKFRGRGGSHNGVDIAMLKGTKLLSLVNGGLEWKPSTGNIGNSVWINFKYRGNNYTFVYGHLDGKIGSAPRKVSARDEVAVSGCTGNTTYCGQDNCVGKREDHVHIVLYGPSGLMDPVPFVGWNLQYYDDSTCKYISCP